ncbi:MAG: MazG family protein, partial [Chloroflexota bacterium]|nr:MazG family protein [Chloroflexota bacterium]
VTDRTVDITIVGLGPGDRARRTRAVQEAVDNAETLFLRTARHPGIEDLAGRAAAVALEELPGRNGRDWSVEVNAVCDAAARGTVVLAVPGHPRYGERLVIDTIAEAERRGLTIEVHEGLSAIDMVSTALRFDPMVADVHIVDARQLVESVPKDGFQGGYASFSPLRPMLFSRVYGNRIAAPLARLLLRILPPEHPVIIVEAAGILGSESIEETTVAGLEDAKPAHLSSVWVPPLDRLSAGRDPRTLQHVVARLRMPDGCPWDRKQSNATLRDALIDEVYEAVDAIDVGDMENLAEELGDLFLLIAMHAQIAEEAGQFTLEDVYDGIATKIVRRHPHVFGDDAAEHAEEVVGLWQRIKAEEREGGKRATKASDGQPHAMPALERAKRVLKKRPHPQPASNADATGDQLLAIVAGIIDAGDDPEAALRAALERHVEATERDIP